MFENLPAQAVWMDDIIPSSRMVNKRVWITPRPTIKGPHTEQLRDGAGGWGGLAVPLKSTLQLFDIRGAVPSARVHLALREKGRVTMDPGRVVLFLCLFFHP